MPTLPLVDAFFILVVVFLLQSGSFCGSLQLLWGSEGNALLSYKHCCQLWEAQGGGTNPVLHFVPVC